MSFAMPGLTHCVDCGNTLEMNEHYRCKRCDKEYEKQVEENKLNELVTKMVKNELAKQTKEIVDLEIFVDNKSQKLKGYWENKYSKFIVIN